MSKKSVVEVNGFLFITFIVIVFSSVAFFFSKSFIEDSQKEFEEEILTSNLYEFSKKFSEYKRYSGSVFSQDFFVTKGILIFNNSKLEYFPNSEISSVDLGVCFDFLCTQGRDSTYINISPFNFSNYMNITSEATFSFEIDKENLKIIFFRTK